MGDTGNSLWTSIGHFFERTLEQRLQGLVLEKITRHPDLHSEGKTFWIEAKSGFKRNGPHVHNFQWWYDAIQEPVIYAFGYHNFNNVHSRIGHLKTERGRRDHLGRHLTFDSVYFLSFDIVKKIYAQEAGKGAGRQASDLVMQSSMPKHVVTGREFTREGKTVTGPEYYGYDPAQYVAQELVAIPGLPFKCGYLVKKEDEAVLQFFKQNGLAQ